MIGFGRHGVANISLRYSKDHAATKGRQQQIADPKFVTAICEAFTSSLREGLAEGESNTLRERDRQEALDLQQNYTQPETPLPGNSACPSDLQPLQILLILIRSHYFKSRPDFLVQSWFTDTVSGPKHGSKNQAHESQTCRDGFEISTYISFDRRQSWHALVVVVVGKQANNFHLCLCRSANRIDSLESSERGARGSPKS